jgi:hypothetical protein
LNVASAATRKMTTPDTRNMVSMLIYVSAPAITRVIGMSPTAENIITLIAPEQRLREFHEGNSAPVLGPREGGWLELDDDSLLG